MSTTASPTLEQPERSKTADGSLNRRRCKSTDRRQATTRATSSYRHNKLYRCPQTPPPEVQFDRERSFILDSKAVSNISNDYSIANPKLGSVIPPYNAQLDRHVDNYFKFFGVRKALEGTGQSAAHESIAGRVHDRFYTNGHGYRYLSLRNKFGSGHSIEEVRGHELFLSDPKAVVNYNGLFGFRRNTPSLRRQPNIGTIKLDANGYIPIGRYSVVGCDLALDFSRVHNSSSAFERHSFIPLQRAFACTQYESLQSMRSSIGQINKSSLIPTCIFGVNIVKNNLN
ncbi:unnamed protein product [Rotaria sp. Silwood1]|nr:unnamed protein product [Rotaria sp. Silwood1]CAF0928807.1 unnamed protein product [Rotaria sp. Silwood1]CAF1113451.1 unnamed protein product [Rotaria sp. Silwood1]